MKRYLAALVAFVLLMGVAALPAVAEQQEEVELIYWIIGPGKQKDSDRVWEAVNEEIAQILPNTKVSFVDIPGSEYADKWSKALAAQERIDLAWTGYTHILANEVTLGSIVPLDDLVSEYGQDIVAFFGEDVLDLHRLSDGKLYQIPAWQGLVGWRNGMQLPAELVALLPAGWIEELQAAVYDANTNCDMTLRAKVYDMMEAYLVAAKDAGKLGLGYNVAGGINGRMLSSTLGVSLANYTKIAYADPGYTVTNTYASEEFRLNCEFVARWYEMGLIRQDIASLETVEETNWQRDGLSGYITQGHNAFTDDIAQSFSAEAGFEIEVIFSRKNCVFQRGFVTGTSIPFTSKYPERAMQLINLLYRPEAADAYQTFVYGLKGEHYTDNGGGVITTLCGDGSAGADWAYGNYKWVMGTCTNALTTQTDIPGYYDVLKAVEDSAEILPFATFSFDNAPVMIEQANIKAVVAEYNTMLMRGYLGDGWEAKYEEFLVKLDQAGMANYLAEVQRQVDAYVEAGKYIW